MGLGCIKMLFAYLRTRITLRSPDQLSQTQQPLKLKAIPLCIAAVDLVCDANDFKTIHENPQIKMV